MSNDAQKKLFIGQKLMSEMPLNELRAAKQMSRDNSQNS